MREEKNYKLVFKWTVSKGRNSYGYNICTLFVDGKKHNACNGGGYDLQGTCLGNWIAREFEKELLKLEIPLNWRNGEKIQEYYGLTFHNPNFDPGKAEIDGMTVEEREEKNLSCGLERYQAFYRASSKVPTEKHVIPLIDGACGFSSVETILNGIGYEVKYIHESKNESIYLVTKK